jgi:hypothetical protein
MEQINSNLPSKSTPRDVFMHLLAIVLLYIGIFGLIALLWKYVDVLRPDQLDTYYGYSNASAVMKNSIASLLVVWPVFMLVNWLIKKEEKKEIGKRDIKVKKWLLYLTLFIASLTMIIDLIMLINNFLDGSLTLNFFLKVLVVLLIAGAVFGYYLWDLKQESDTHTNLPKLFGWISSGIIFVIIVAGFFIMGSPSEQRAKRFDEQRVQSLQSLQYEVINYWQAKKVLPAKLSDLNNSVTGFSEPLDPQSQTSFEYEIKSDLVFSLCANFASNGADIKNGSVPAVNGYQENWQHSAGRVCFERTIDPDFYKDVNTLEKPVEIIR